jgi:hypothetical protein
MVTKTEGCWASVLGDCEDPLTKEHTPSLAFWLAEHPKANRKARKRAPIRRQGYGVEPGDVTANDLFDLHLCQGHNNATSELDEEAGRFSRALASFVRISVEREANPGVRWTHAQFAVDGPLVERWFMKMAINGVASQNQPIGHPDAERGKQQRNNP